MPIEKIILLEDDLIVRKHIEQQLRNRRYEVAACATMADAEDYLARDSFDLMIVDVNLPDGKGTDLLKYLQARAVRPLVVIMSASGTIESAVDCMRNGAFDYLIKPFSTEQLEITLKKAGEYTQLVKVNQFLSHDEDEPSELLGQSKPMEELRALIRKVARTQATVLIQGESGTGKELVARALYTQSTRTSAPFIKVNCAAIPENLIESEFFGHERGAFTGALNKREGRFELAHGGTILLDEVSEITPNVQAKLLRVLQERELERVGGNKTIKVDVRVLATTNRKLEESVERKEFRQDLYFRLNVVPIVIPPLRERLDDVPLLAERFCQLFTRKHGAEVLGLSPSCLQALLQHNWPGNVRELQNVIERAVILCSGGVIEPAQLGFGRRLEVAAAATGTAPAPVGLPRVTASSDICTLGEAERRHIIAAVERCQGNRTHAARKLDISIRTLRNKLNEYGYKGPPDTESEGAV